MLSYEKVMDPETMEDKGGDWTAETASGALPESPKQALKFSDPEI